MAGYILIKTVLNRVTVLARHSRNTLASQSDKYFKHDDINIAVLSTDISVSGEQYSKKLFDMWTCLCLWSCAVSISLMTDFLVSDSMVQPQIDRDRFRNVSNLVEQN